MENLPSNGAGSEFEPGSEESVSELNRGVVVHLKTLQEGMVRHAFEHRTFFYYYIVAVCDMCSSGPENEPPSRLWPVQVHYVWSCFI